ncbi:ATP-binding protein [Marinitoga sp. 38H-ov]|uniref:ATP-binding protein n=1 Tax=Marinitoga sp. 38H-ov TaxID=1755814 RepID=UPI0013E9C392|nr:ATP-binding protein [Marinitoga sp. 38H-ov]KAF2955707.1 hypothetical protein AS160_00930 [Marinitoga sp. 38H-ov]
MKTKFIIPLYIFISLLTFSYIKLYDGWEYRWEDEKTWHTYENPGVPLENKNKMLYLRYKLPDIYLENPAIYLTGIFDNSSMHIENIEIYNTFSKSFFSPKSIFKIPNNFQNKYLIIKVSSGRKDVGFFGEFLLGNEMELFIHQIFVELDKILLIIFGLFVLIISITIYIYFYISQKDSNIRKAILYLGIFSFGISAFISGQTQIFKYIYDNRVFWAYMMDFGKYISPIGLMGYFFTIFDYSTKKILKSLVIFHIFYFFAIVVFQLLNGFEKNYFVIYVVYLYLAMLLDIIIMIYNLHIGIKQKDYKAYIFSVSIIVVSLFTIYEILGDYRIIKWERPYVQWSIFILINSMIFLILRNIKELNLELSVKNRILEDWNKELEKLVNKKTNSIKLLLDSSGEGFFTFDKNYIIGNEYSKECINIFGENIEGKNIFDILFLKEQNFIKRVLDDLFNEKDNFKKEVYLTFLPSEIKIDYRYYNINFKYIENEDIIMVILKDITSEKELELKILNEKDYIMKILSVVKYYDIFVYYIKEFKNIILKENLNNFLPEIHNFKGIFSQFYLKNLVQELHNIENDIIENKNINIRKLRNIFEEEIKNIENDLGHKIDEDILKIPKNKIKELEDNLIKVLGDNNTLILELRKLRFKRLKDLITPYFPYIEDLAKRHEKVINPPKLIEKNIIYVDPQKYFNFIKSLIHIFRNAIVHGIESPEIRLDFNKDIKGNIITTLYKENNLIHVIIEDDGIGIDIEKIKKLADEKNMKYDNLLNVIFNDNFSTKDSIDYTSGRGVGLYSVKREIERLNGKIEVYSNFGKGTKFHIIIPEVIK